VTIGGWAFLSVIPEQTATTAALASVLRQNVHASKLSLNLIDVRSAVWALEFRPTICHSLPPILSTIAIAIVGAQSPNPSNEISDIK
jgi:hypothetical protein